MVGRWAAGGAVCLGLLGYAHGETVIYPRHVGAVAGADPKDYDDIIDAEMLRDSLHTIDKNIPITEIGELSYDFGKLHPGIKKIKFSGRLTVREQPPPNWGHRPHSGGGGGHSGGDGGYGHTGAQATYLTESAYGTSDLYPSEIDCGSRDIDEEGGCKYLEGRYIDVEGEFYRKKYHNIKEKFDFSLKTAGGPDHDQCYEEFVLTQFNITTGFLQINNTCWDCLDFSTGDNCTCGCAMDVSCKSGGLDPCDIPLNVQLVLDVSKSMGQSKINSVVKPLATTVVKGQPVYNDIWKVGVAGVDDRILMKLPLGNYREAQIISTIDRLEQTQRYISLADIASEVASMDWVTDRSFGNNKKDKHKPQHPQESPMALVFITVGDVVSTGERRAYETDLKEIYAGESIVPQCVIVDNSSPNIAHDVAQFCGCRDARSCPNLMWVDGSDPDMIANVGRKLRQRVCRAQKNKLGKPLYGALPGKLHDELKQHLGWKDDRCPNQDDKPCPYEDEGDSKNRPYLDTSGKKKYIRGPREYDNLLESTDNVISAAGQNINAIHASISAMGGNVLPDGLAADSMASNSTYDVNHGYYYNDNINVPYSKQDKWANKQDKWNNKWNNTGYYPDDQYNGYGGKQWGNKQIFNGDTINKQWDFNNNNNGKYGRLNAGIVAQNEKNEHSGTWFPHKPQLFKEETYILTEDGLPEQMPVMTMQTNAVDYNVIEKTIGMQTWLDGVSAKFAKGYNIPPQQVATCCGGPVPTNQQGSGGQFLKSSASSGVQWKMFLIDAQERPNREAGSTPQTALEIADQFRSLVGHDLSESNALGPYLSPRTTMTELVIADSKSYKRDIVATRGAQNAQKQKLFTQQSYPVPYTNGNNNTYKAAISVLQINLTLCAYMLKRNNNIDNQSFVTGKEAGNCLLSEILNKGNTNTCGAYVYRESPELDADVSDALRALQNITGDPNTMAALQNEGAKAISLFDIAGGLPEPFSLQGPPNRGYGHPPDNGHPEHPDHPDHPERPHKPKYYDLCPNHNGQAGPYRRPLRDAIRNTQKAVLA